MKIELSKFQFTTLKDENVPEILSLQDNVIASLNDPDILRKNTEEMFHECVRSPHFSIGVRYDGKLIGVGILYIPSSEQEDLSHLLVGVETTNKKSANYKLCMVDKEYRGNGLQYALGVMLENKAKELGVELLCATVSPNNAYSENNMLKLGYTLNTTLPKYGTIRNIFYKLI